MSTTPMSTQPFQYAHRILKSELLNFDFALYVYVQMCLNGDIELYSVLYLSTYMYM